MTWSSSSLGSFSMSSSATKTAYPKSASGSYQYMYYWQVVPALSGTLTAEVTSNNQSQIRMFLTTNSASFSSSDGSISPYIDKEYSSYPSVSGSVNADSTYRVWIGYNTTTEFTGNVTVKFNLNSAHDYDYYWTVNYYNGSTRWDGDSYSESYSSSGNRTHTFKIPSSYPHKEGYTFLGWSTSSSATSPTYYAGGNVTVTATYESSYTYSGNVNLYAVFVRNYTVYWTLYYYSDSSTQWDADTHSETQASLSTGHDFYITYREPTKQGYEFLGWSTSSSATTPSYEYGDTIHVTAYQESSYVYSGSKTLYAVWKYTPTVYYSWILNYGAGGMYDVQTYGETDTVGEERQHRFYCSSVIPTKSGYTFLGWSFTNGATTAQYTAGDAIWRTAVRISATNYAYSGTLYPVWQKNSISKFYWTGSDSGDNTSITTGQSASNITAARWTNLQNKINELETALKETPTSFTTVHSGDTFRAEDFNEVRNAIVDLPNRGTVPSTKVRGATVAASLFNGTGSLKSALNTAIQHFNDN